MAKKIIQMYDKYQSTTKVYPKIIGECLTEDALDKIKSEVETKYEITQVVVEDNEPVGFSIKDTENDVVYNIPVSGGGKQLYQHCIKLNDTNGTNPLKASITIINDSDETLNTYAKIASYLYNNNLRSEDTCLNATGRHRNDNQQLTYIIYGVYSENGTSIYTAEAPAATGVGTNYVFASSTTTVTDTVIEL